MPALLIGLVAGVMLAALRAPLGVELFQLPAVSGAVAAGYRAAALAAVGLGVLAAAPALGEGERPAAGRLALGAAAGFALRALFWEADPPTIGVLVGAVLLLALLASLRGGLRGLGRGLKVGLAGAGIALAVLLASFPERPGPAFAFGLLGLGAMVLLGRGSLFVPRAAVRAAESTGHDDERGSYGELTGLALAGAGAAIALEGIARHLRLFGAGLAQDDALLGGLFLVLVAVGTAAFGASFQGRTARAAAAGLCLAAAAVVGFASLRAIGNLSTPLGLDRYLKDVGERLPGVELAIGRQGTLLYDLAVFLPALALPGILVGGGLRACRGPLHLGAVLLGGAAGLVAAPALLSFELELASSAAPRLVESSSSAWLIASGAKLAPLGALLAIALGHGLGARGLRIGAALGLVLAVLGFALPARPIQVLEPWELRRPAPELVLETPEGQLEVQGPRLGIAAVLLDGRPLAPRLEHAPEDRAQLAAAMRLLPPEVRARQEARVLLIGQLTPGRALVLEELGAGTIDRTGAWAAAMPLVEAELFEGHQLPEGEVLPIPAARRRMAAGEYDLVLVPPVPGDAPTTRGLGWPRGPSGEAPRETVVVVWLDTRTDFAHLELGERVLPVTASLTDLGLAICYGGPGGDPLAGLANALAAGEPLDRPDPVDRLRTSRPERLRENRARIARRLAGANREGAAGPLTEGLARFYASQRRSSAFEAAARQVELEPEALALFREAGVAAEERTAFLEQVLESLAAILRGKRWVEEIDQVLGPVAAKHHPWPALEEALAYADLELLDPEMAAQRMGRLLQRTSGTAEAWALYAEALAQSGKTREAAESFWKALERAPANRTLRRRLAIQLVLAGDPEGPAMVRDLLLEEPDDVGLEVYLGTGPFPELPRGFPLPPTDEHVEGPGHSH